VETRRHIISSLRPGLLILGGTALFALPVILDLGSAAIVTGVFVGILAMALGFAATDTTGRGTLPLTAHAVYDRGLAVGLLLTGVIFGLFGQEVALAVFAGAGLIELALSSLTRYTATHA